MKRLPGMPPAPSRQRTRPSGKARNGRDEDIDLLSALREQEQAKKGTSSGNRPKAAVARRPAVRTGGRVRMDAGKSTQSDAREAPILAPRYRRNSKPRNWKRIVLGVLLVAAVAYGIGYGLTTPKLALENLQIEGVSASTAQVLQDKLPSDPFGKNLLLYAILHGRAVHQAMANAEPDFADAAVGLRFPHTLTVRITQRTPYALLVAGADGDQGRWILDSRGIPIRMAGGLPAGEDGLVKIDLLTADASANAQDAPISETSIPITLGRPLPGDLAESVSQAYALMRDLRKQPSIDQVASIQVDNSQNMGLNMTNHLRIKLGQPDQIDAKLALVAGLLTQQPEIASEAQYVDVSYPARPAMMPKISGGNVGNAVDQTNATGGDATAQNPSVTSLVQ